MKAVNKTVSSLEGVETVKVDFDNKLATITMKEGEELSEKTLKNALPERFTVTKFKQTKEAKKDDAKKGESNSYTVSIKGMT